MAKTPYEEQEWKDNDKRYQGTAARFKHIEKGTKTTSEEAIEALTKAEAANERAEASELLLLKKIEALEGGNTQLPTAITEPANSITGSSATLTGLVNPNGSPTTVAFEWGPNTSYGQIAGAASPGSGRAVVPVSSTIQGTGVLLGATLNRHGVTENAYGTKYLETFLTPGNYDIWEPENELKMQTTYSSGESSLTIPTEANITHFNEMITKLGSSRPPRGHNLLWDRFLPHWASAGTFTPTSFRTAYHNYISRVVTAVGSKVFCWDVINEAISDLEKNTIHIGKFTEVFSSTSISTSSEIMKFFFESLQWAHEAEPNALLFINQYNAGGEPTKETELATNLLFAETLLFMGAPLNGIGLQYHLNTEFFPTQEAVESAISKYIALGLEVHVTELDIEFKGVSGTLENQGKIAEHVINGALAAGASVVNTWGLGDAFSDLGTSTLTTGPRPLPMNVEYEPKPFLKALKEKQGTPILSGDHYRVIATNSSGKATGEDRILGPGVTGGGGAGTPGVPVPSLSLSGETVSWNHVGSETKYTVAVSSGPRGSVRSTGYVVQEKIGVEPQAEFIGSMKDAAFSTASSVKLLYSSLSAGAIKVGDIILVQLNLQNTSTVITAPSGFNLIQEKTTGPNTKLALYWSRYVSGTEFTFSWTPTTEFSIIAGVSRNNISLGSPVDKISWIMASQESGKTSLTTETISNTFANEMVYISFVNDQGWTWTAPSGYTSFTTENPLDQRLFYKLQSTAGTVEKATSNTTGSHAWASAALALSLLPELQSFRPEAGHTYGGLTTTSGQTVYIGVSANGGESWSETEVAVTLPSTAGKAMIFGMNGAQAYGHPALWVENKVYAARSNSLDFIYNETTPLAASEAISKVLAVGLKIPYTIINADNSTFLASINTTTYAEKAAAIIKRVITDHPTVTVFEILNEPYFKGPHNRSNAVDYANIVKATYEKCEAEGITGVSLLVAGFGDYPLMKSNGEALGTTSLVSAGNGWIVDMYAAQPKLKTLINGWSVHNYGNINASRQGEYDFLAPISMREVIIGKGGSGYNNFHITEIGWAVGSKSANESGVPNAAAQASNMEYGLKTSLEWHEAGWMQAYIVYNDNVTEWGIYNKPAQTVLTEFAKKHG